MIKVDKKNGECLYNDELHSYWVNGNENDKFVSVTTLISQFHEKFDANFWGRYKAFEELADKNAFMMEKKTLLASKKWNNEILSRYNIDELIFNTKVNEIIDGYEYEKNIACDRGNRIHLQQEQNFYKKPFHELKQYGLGGKFKCTPNDYSLTEEKGIYPEYLVYKITKDGVLKIAGQIDLLIKDGNDIHILDYKSSKKIEKKSFFNQSTKTSKMMNYPINNIPDCNFYHYSLQLSLYAWMIEQMNPSFNIKSLTIIHYAHDDSVTNYEVDYHKDDVIRMLGFYKKQKQIEIEKNKHDKIIF